ncbi:polysaccharide deacetylase family protein [bacterium]|nr:polysaccharide deacetylase family protein [bacterium]
MTSPAAIPARWRDVKDFIRLGGPVLRTHPLLENVFPDVVWGMPDPVSSCPIHLTFDDGPDPNGTPRILDVLARHNIPATFFLTGSGVVGQPKLVGEILTAGHRIGYHGLSHDTWWFRLRTRRDVEMDPSIITHLDGNPFEGSRKPLLLRAPYGRIDFATLTSADRLNARLVHWRLAIRDWMDDVPASTLARMLYRYAHPGDILLLHDGGPNTRALAKALDLVIPAWKRAGMKLKSIEPFLETFR